VRDVEPVGEDDQAQALFLDVSGDLVDLARVVLLLGVDDQEGARGLHGVGEYKGEKKKRREREREAGEKE
jgi:hypothetical protein